MKQQCVVVVTEREKSNNKFGIIQFYSINPVKVNQNKRKRNCFISTAHKSQSLLYVKKFN